MFSCWSYYTVTVNVIKTRHIFVFNWAFYWKEILLLGLHLPKFFFMQLLVYPVTLFFFWYAIPKELGDDITPMSA